MPSRILDYLGKCDDGSAVEIGHAIGVDPSHVAQALSQLLAKGRLIRPARGQYKLDPDYSDE